MKFFLFLAILICGYVIMRHSRCSAYLDPEKIKNIMDSMGKWAPFTFISIYALRPIVLFPASILTVAGGISFGPVTGTLYSVIGATAGAVLALFVARMLGRDFILLVFGDRLSGIESAISMQGTRIFFILRLIPVMPFDIVNYTAGLMRIRLSQYILGTVSGLIPATFVYTYFGDSLRKIYSIQFFLSLLLFVFLIAAPYLYEKNRKKKGMSSIMDLGRKNNDND